MKKIQLWLAAASMMMMAAACSSEANEPAQPTQEKASVEFTVNLDGIESRANGDGTTADQLIFAVFDSEGNELAALRQNDVAVTGREATVKTSVARGQNYTFVFWAQKKVGENLNDNGFYNTTNLKDVVVNYSGEANDERRDAFTQVVALNNVTDDINQTVYLHRPFAQVDYVCETSEWLKFNFSNFAITGSDLTVAAGAYTHLNLLTGVASEPTQVPFTMTEKPFITTQGYDEVNYAYTFSDPFITADEKEYFWLSMNYILATPEISKLSTVQMNLYTMVGEEKRPVEIKLDEVPIQRNHRTVVYVAGLTKVVTTVIGIDPTFNGDM